MHFGWGLYICIHLSIMQLPVRFYTFIALLICGTGMTEQLYAQGQTADTLRRDTFSLKWFSLEGRVVGGEEKEALPGAYIYLGEKKIPLTTTGRDGEFKLERLPAGKIRLAVSYIGYREFSETYDVNENLNVGEICLESIVLEEAVIKADPPLIVQRGDTTQFNVVAVKLAEDADLEALLKKLPGFEIVDGKIMARGKEVTKLYIDGIEYSFNNPAAALKNLPANLIAKVKMYDDRSEEAKFSGYDDGQKFRTLNLETHRPDLLKVFGNARAGYGITAPLKNTFRENNYQGSLSANLFDRKRKITMSGDFTNTGQDNELPGSRLTGEGGDNRSQACYIDFSSEWKENSSVSGNYTYSGNRNYSASLSHQEYFPSDHYASRIYDNESHSRGKGKNHAFNAHTGLQFNEKNRLSFSPVFALSDYASHMQSINQNIENGDTLNQTYTRNRSESAQKSAEGDLLWMHAFDKKGRTFSFRVNGRFSRDESEQAQNNRERAWKDADHASDTMRNLLIEQERSAYQWNTSLNWSEPLTEHARLGVNYSYQESTDRSDKESLSFRDERFEELTGIDTAQTTCLENTYRIHGYGLNYNYFRDRFRLYGGITLRQTRMRNSYRYIGAADSLVESNYIDIAPLMNAGLKLKENMDFNIAYNGSSRSPDASQLQNVLDVSNPLQLTMGNPRLRKSYQHNLNMSYFYRLENRSMFLNSGVRAGQTFNQITTNVKFIQRDTVINGYAVLRGSQLTIPVNLNGNWDISAYLNSSFPWKKLKLYFSTDLSYRFSHTPSIYDDVKNVSDLHSASFRLNIVANISEELDFNCSSQTSYSYTKNSSGGNSQVFNENVSGSFYYSFRKKVFLRVGYDGRFFINKKGERVNQTDHVLQATIGSRFGEKRRMEVTLSANDILKARNTVDYSLNDLYAVTTYHTMPSAYYMLSFSYRFNSMEKNRSH